MSSLLADMVTYLTTAALVTGDGVDTFRDFQPEDPDNIVVLIEYQGSGTHYDLMVSRSIQISARNTNANSARLKALSIYNKLKTDAIANEDARVAFTTTRWGQVFLRTVPIRIKQDERNRTVYGFNVGVNTTTE